MLTKTIVFQSKYGRKMKISEIPVLEENNPLNFIVNSRLQRLIFQLVNSNPTQTNYSFRKYLKRTIKWKEYKKIYYRELMKVIPR